MEQQTSAAAAHSAPFPLHPDAPARDGTAPDLPPSIASVRSHTADEIVHMMNRTPLFMTSLETTDDEDGHNVELEAMRALQYEGTAADIAQGFREQGNEMAKAKRWKDGREYYSKGIAALTHKERLPGSEDSGYRNQTESDVEAEIREGREVEEACYTNRALCNLGLKNYRSTTLDCAAALRLNPRNVKAYYRSSSALLALDKLKEAEDACIRGLTIEPNNVALLKLKTDIQARTDRLLVIRQREQEKLEHARKEKLMLTTALKARNVRLRQTGQPPDLEDAVIHLVPDALSPKSTLNFPMILFYPLHAQSDFVKAIAESENVSQHLEYILPLPWDTDREYTIRSVELYMETDTGGLVKIGKNVILGTILGTDGVEVVDGLVRVNVVPKCKAANWIEEMKARKGKSNR